MTPALKGQPMAILSEIDAWAAANGHCMMTIGPDRSTSIIEIIRSTHPKIMAEIGGYIGYSAILFGHEVRKAGGTRYISFELNDEYASIAKSLVEFAGLGNFVEILRGPSSQSLCRFHEEDRNKGLRFDVLFVDHAEELYLADLKVCEKLGLVGCGSVIVADNVKGRGAKEYAGWVEENDAYETKRIPCILPNGHEVRIWIF